MRSARVEEGDSRTTIASSGSTSRRAPWTVEAFSGSVISRSPGTGVRLRRRAARLGDRLDQRRQGEADVGDDRVAHRRPHRLVGVGGDRDQAGALGQQRPGDVRVVGEDRAADDEDQVVALERLADRADRRRQDAAEVRVVLGEAEADAAGRGRGPDREALALGEGDGAAPSRRRCRCRGRRRGPGCAAASSSAASAATAAGSATARPVTLRVIAWRASAASSSTLPVVHRQGDEDRAARRQPGEVGAVGERQRHVLGARRLVAPLDQRVRHPGRVAVGEVGLQGDLGARLLARGDQQRRVVGLGVEDRPHRVADPGRGVQVDDGGAAGGLGEAVGHPDHDRLLQAEHVAEVGREVGQHRQLGRAGVAEDRRHPLLAEEVERGLADGRHRRQPIRYRSDFG